MRNATEKAIWKVGTVSLTSTVSFRSPTTAQTRTKVFMQKEQRCQNIHISRLHFKYKNELQTPA